MNKKSIIITFLYVLILVFIQAFRFLDEVFEKPVFIISNILFSLFVILKLISLRKEKLFLLNPMFLAGLKMFLLAYGFTIFYIYLQDTPLIDSILVPHPYKYMNNGMLYASIGFIATWYSYSSDIVKRIAINFVDFVTRKKTFIRENLEPRWYLIFMIFGLSIVFKLILISYGVYGVLSTIFEQDIEIPFLSLIVVLSSAGSGALLFLNLYFFKTGNKKILFYLFFLIDFFFSIITGFKGAIVMSIIIVGIAYYIVYGKIKYIHILYTFFAIQFAYSIVTPYRYYMQSHSDFDGTSVTGIVQGFMKSYEWKKDLDDDESDKYAAIKRFNFIPELTKFQEYKIERGLREDDPNFVFMTLTTPLQIFTPRFLWKDKPKSDLGKVWVTQKVFGIDYNSSTAFGPLGFLYLTGGVVAIFFGFILVGFVLQIVNVFLTSGYWGGVIIALVLLAKTISLEAQFNYYFNDFVPALLFAMIFQYVIFKKNGHHGG